MADIDQDPAANHVLQALNTLYTNTDRQTQEQANCLVGRVSEKGASSFSLLALLLTREPEAWTSANLILRSKDLPLEPRLFAAQTFRTKVTYDLHQLDSSARASLRDSLVDLLQTYRAGPKVIITYICLALAGLALQMPEWKNVVQQSMETFGSSADTVDCLLEFVAVLPEEVSGNTRIPIGDAEYHTRSIELLKDNAERVLQLLVAFMETSGVNTSSQLRVFKCLYNWLKSGDIPIDTFAATPLFSLVFTGLKDEELFDSAVDAACEIIHETRETHEHLSVIQQIYQHLTDLRPNLSACVDDPDQFRGYCRVFTEAGEAYQKLIVEHPDTFAELLNAMVECTAYPDLDIVPMTFNFWYALKTTLMREESAAVRPQFAPVFSHLVDVMLKHLHYPADLDSWSAQERDDFRSFRHVMGDVLKDCCSVVGSQECLAKPVEIVMNAMSSLKQGHQVEWQDIEAHYFQCAPWAVKSRSTSPLYSHRL